jgi:hypothetical protein
VPFPDTVVPVPTAVPPDVQEVGAEDCGPKTVKLMVPVGLDPEASTELTALAAMAAPAVPVPGPTAVTVGEAFGIVNVAVGIDPAAPGYQRFPPWPWTDPALVHCAVAYSAQAELWPLPPSVPTDETAIDDP